jgi:hypothetical protein
VHFSSFDRICHLYFNTLKVGTLTLKFQYMHSQMIKFGNLHSQSPPLFSDLLGKHFAPPLLCPNVFVSEF